MELIVDKNIQKSDDIARLGARIPRDLHRAVRLRSVESGDTLNDIVTDALRLYLTTTSTTSDSSTPPVAVQPD